MGNESNTHESDPQKKNKKKHNPGAFIIFRSGIPELNLHLPLLLVLDDDWSTTPHPRHFCFDLGFLLLQMDDLKFPGPQPVICKPEGNRFADWALKQIKDVHRCFATTTTTMIKNKKKMKMKKIPIFQDLRCSQWDRRSLMQMCDRLWLVWDLDFYKFQRQQLGKLTVDGLEIQRSPVDILNIRLILRRCL